MNIQECEDLAARILAAIDKHDATCPYDVCEMPTLYLRERVASDLGLYRASYKASCVVGAVARTAALDSLRRTALLYGVKL